MAGGRAGIERPLSGPRSCRDSQLAQSATMKLVVGSWPALRIFAETPQVTRGESTGAGLTSGHETCPRAHFTLCPFFAIGLLKFAYVSRTYRKANLATQVAPNLWANDPAHLPGGHGELRTWENLWTHRVRCSAWFGVWLPRRAPKVAYFDAAQYGPGRQANQTLGLPDSIATALHE